MIKDTSFFQEFWYAEKIDDYFNLIEFMKKFDSNFYEKMNIQTKLFNTKDIEIELPLIIYFKACFLYAKSYCMDYYNFCIQISKKEKFLKNIFKEEIKEANYYYKKWYKGSYEKQSGIKNAKKRREKLSNSMKKFPIVFIKQRNAAISRGKMKKVLHINSGITYCSLIDASLKTGLSVYIIGKICRKQLSEYKGNQFIYIDFDNP